MIPLNVECLFYSFKGSIFNETEEFESVNLDHLFYILVALSALIIGYELADLTVHPLPPKNDRGWIFSHRCLVPLDFFPQRKSGFCRRYSHWNAQKPGITS